MKPAPFAYADPTTVDEALALLAEFGEDAVLLAGGQSLVPELNFRHCRPGLVIDLGRVADLAGCSRTDARVAAGATATVLELAAIHPAAGVAEAVRCIGHPQIRCRSTVGGTIGLAEPAAELPAALTALGGTISLRSVDGERSVDATDWFLGQRVTARRPDELITKVTFGVPDGPSRWMEVARRPNDLPIVGLFVAVDRGAWSVALSGVADRPVRARRCEAVLTERAGPVTDLAAAATCLDAAVAELLAELRPPADAVASSDHRRGIAAALLRRAIAPRPIALAA